MTPPTVLFDLDGTLLDSIQLILESYHYTLDVHGLERRPDSYWLAGIGTPLRAQLEEVAREAVSLDVLVETYRSYNHEHHDRLVGPYPGVVEMVRALRALGCPIGIVTSKMRKGALRGLRVSGLVDVVDVVVGADDVKRAKPHPEPVMRALDELDADADSTIFVGDSVHDMRAGRAAGVATGAVLWGPFARRDLQQTRPTYWFDRPADVLTFAQSFE